MLYTNLKHIETADEHARILNENENVMVICGTMGTSSIQVYRIAEELESEYTNVKFFDMEFDNPESNAIRTLPELSGFVSIPFSIYYKKGIVVKVTSGIQTRVQVAANLENEFATAVNA